ncbi:MAG: sulfotransferase [Candidatus Aminicenantes bacterium]|nr:sulfotransferase [Candidatus Aminicenantes bacterium]
MDHLFFSGYKKRKLHKPLFLIGHPRSGTTFLHKFILKNTSEFKGMLLWEMIFPSIFLRRCVRPFLPFLAKKIPQGIYDSRIHETGLEEPETDDVAMFFRSFAGMFYWLYFSAWHKYNNPEELSKHLIKESEPNKVIGYLENLHKKNLHKTEIRKRIFSKSFSLIMDISGVLKRFENARIIVLLRDPMEVIPSSISLAVNIQKQLNDFDNLEEKKKQRYYQNIYQASWVFFKYFDRQMSADKSLKDNILIVTHKQLKTRFEETMIKICDYCEIEKSPEFMQKIKMQAEKQPDFKSKHRYSLETYGITKEKVLNDFDFIYAQYDL